MQALNDSDSDSDGNYQQAPGPVLYRLRADGRQVPLTEGHGMNLAHRKGLIQEVVVSPRRVPQTLAEHNSPFATHNSSQPESVILHSIELPQVQLGDREVADSAPQDGGSEQTTRRGVPQNLDLPVHPSLLHLQQQQMQQSLQPHILTSSGTHSMPLGDSASQRGVSRINSLNSLSSEYLKASEREASNQAAAAAAMHAQQSSGMTQWGLPRGSVAFPGNPGDTSRSQSAQISHFSQAPGQPYGSHGLGFPRGPFMGGASLHNSAPLAMGQPGFRHLQLVSDPAVLCDTMLP